MPVALEQTRQQLDHGNVQYWMQSRTLGSVATARARKHRHDRPEAGGALTSRSDHLLGAGRWGCVSYVSSRSGTQTFISQKEK